MAETSNLRFLVIDDDRMVGSLVSDLLVHALHAHQVDLAASGAEGVALFDRNPYDVVVTDLMMPGMNGWQVADILRARNPGVKLVMMTGAGTPETFEHARASGFAMIAKPINVQDFRKAIERLLTGPATA